MSSTSQSDRADLFLRVKDALKYRTPLSTGLTMYYSTVPSILRHRNLPIPSYSAAIVHLGPFEHRPAGAFLKFKMHRSPIEEFISRWRTGDIRAIVTRMGTPTTGMTHRDEAALLRDRDTTDWNALLRFRQLILVEREDDQVRAIQGEYQLREGAELFAHLAYAAVASLEFEVRCFIASWTSLEQRQGRERRSVRGAIFGVANAIATFFVCSSSTSKVALPAAPHVCQRRNLGRVSACADPSVTRELAKPSFRSGSHSATALLAVGGRLL
ncbi:hypothetical protein RQP46_010538 [Phenoliferia psychrophenolica]